MTTVIFLTLVFQYADSHVRPDERRLGAHSAQLNPKIVTAPRQPPASLARDPSLSGLSWRLPDDIRMPAVLASLAVSAWLIATADIINNDGILYLSAAEWIAEGDWAAARALYGWLFYPWLIAVTGRLTGLGLEASAHLIDASMAALMVFAFISIVRELGGDRKVTLLAAFVILFHPYLNDSRSEILRDHGYWALYLLSTLYFLRCYRDPSWRNALTWSSLMVVATVFRIEGCVILLVLPFVLLLKGGEPPAARLQAFGRAHVLNALGLGALVAWAAVEPNFSDQAGRLLDPLRQLNQLWSSLSTGLENKAARLHDAVLNGYTDQYAVPALIAVMILIIADNLIRTLSPLYAILPLFRRFRTRLAFPRGAPVILTSLGGLHLLSALVFLVPNYYMSSRHVVAVSLTLLLVIPFVLASAHDHWVQRARRSSRWPYPLIVAALVFMTADGLLSVGGTSKGYIREAGEWLQENVPADTRLYSNHRKVLFYGGRPLAFNAPPKEVLPENWVPDGAWQRYDYVALWARGKNSDDLSEQLVEAAGLELLASFGNDEGDRVVIFAVRASTGESRIRG